MTKVTIDRELLERIDESAICDGTDATISDGLFTQLVAALDAPRQPEGDGLEVRATEEYHLTKGGVEYYDLCRLYDAQRAIAELREERTHLKGCQENAMLHMTGLVSERDTLREECERLRVFNKSLDEEATKRLQDVIEAENEAHTLRQQRDRLAGILESVEREHELIRRMKNCEVHRGGRGSFGIAVMSDIYAIEWQALDKELQELIGARRAALAEVK